MKSVYGSQFREQFLGAVKRIFIATPLEFVCA